KRLIEVAHAKLFKRTPLRTAIDPQEQVDGDSVAENGQEAVFRGNPFISPKSCDHFRSPSWREGMKADSHDHSQQNRDQRQPHFFTLSLSSARGGWLRSQPPELTSSAAKVHSAVSSLKCP